MMSVLRNTLAGFAVPVAVAAFALVAVTPASAASGGGCTGPSSVGSGYKLKACVSNDAGYANPVGYVSTVGSPKTNCETHVDLIRDGVIVTSKYYAKCTAGTYAGLEYLAQPSGQFFTGIYVTFNGGGGTSETTSPTLTE